MNFSDSRQAWAWSYDPGSGEKAFKHRIFEPRRILIGSFFSVFAMTDLRLKYDTITDLGPFPEIAALIGTYTAQFASMELSLWQIYGVILSIEGSRAMILLGDIQSFSTKLDSIDRYFTQCCSDIEDNYVIKNVFRAAKEINTFRNKLSHSLYLTDKTHTALYLMAYATDPKRQTPTTTKVTSDTANFFNLTTEKMHSELAKVAKIRYEIFTLLKNHRPDSIFYE